MPSIRASLMLAAALGLLPVACHPGDHSAGFGGTTISHEADGGTRLTNAKGTITTMSGPAAQVIPLPSHTPRYPGAEVISAISTSDGKVLGRLIRMDTSEPGTAVIPFYRHALSSNGGRIDTDVQLPGGGMLSGRAGHQRLSVMVGPKDGKTTIIISLSDDTT